MKRMRNAECGMRIGIVLIAVLVLTACSGTIARKEVHQTQASFSSSGRQDSGILEEKTSGPVAGFAVNQDWIDGYASLLAKYGQTLSPPRKAFDRNGITKEGDHYRISDAVMERQLVMNQRRVNDQAP